MPTKPADEPATLADLVAARFGLPSAAGAARPADDPLAVMLDHRTCRQYTDQPVADDLVELLLAAAFSTPSKSDLQQCSVVLVADPQRRGAIADLIPLMPWVRDAPRFLLFCADSRRIRRIAAGHDIPFGNDHLDAVLNAASDAAMHLSTFIWAAESAGLGTCPISVVRNHIAEVSAIVDLPDQVFPLAGLCLGWPARRGWPSMRLPLSVTVHVDRYDDTRAPEEIEAYDHRRAAVHQLPADRQLDAERWGVADFYGWSTDKARMVARRERDDLVSFLRNRGFGLG